MGLHVPPPAAAAADEATTAASPFGEVDLEVGALFQDLEPLLRQVT